jgi:hypothetical protein
VYKLFVIAFAFSVQAEVKDPIGVVKLRAGEPIHIAYWVVISGPNTSLGTDVVRGIEIAVDTFGGSIKGWPLKISGQDAGCRMPAAVPKAARPQQPGWQPTRPLWRPSAPPAQVQPSPACRSSGKPAFRAYRPQTPLRF